jgi:hypothetical protein
MSDRDLTHYKEEEVKARLDETRRDEQEQE